MPDADISPIRSALLHHRSAWTAWFRAVDGSVKEGVVPGGAEAAVLVRSVLQLPSKTSPTRLVSSVRQAFGIEEADRESATGAQGWAKVFLSQPTLFAQEHVFQVAAGSAPTSRRQLVLAHEIAHFFYACLEERANAASKPKKPYGTRTRQAEQFCWDFAIELSCPLEQQRKWTLAFLRDMLTPKERMLADTLSSHGLDQLTYWHLRRLASQYYLSIRAVIRALDHHPILDEALMGIAVFREIPNQWTGRETGLRLWQYARPSWGHIISNKRAAKQGFTSAGDIFDESTDQHTIVVPESLHLWRRKSNERAHWEMVRNKTACAYTTIDVKSEGRYLLAIWHWPR